MVGLDKANDATATIAGECLLDVVLVIRQEVGAFGSVWLWTHGDVILPTKGTFESRVDFRAVVVAAKVEEGGFRARREAMRGDSRFWEGRGFDINVKKLGEAVGDGIDGFEGDSIPSAQITDVPPEM